MPNSCIRMISQCSNSYDIDYSVLKSEYDALPGIEAIADEVLAGCFNGRFQVAFSEPRIEGGTDRRANDFVGVRHLFQVHILNIQTFEGVQMDLLEVESVQLEFKGEIYQ